MQNQYRLAERAVLMRLSAGMPGKARTEYVAFELVRRGIPAVQLSVKGYGVTRPLLPREDRDARASNRRVQFTVAK